MTAKIMTRIKVNNRPVDIYFPPHDEPDLVWVDHYQLLRAFLGSKSEAKAMLERTRNCDGHSVGTAVRRGGRIVNIVPHPIAQALCGAMDASNGFVADHEDDNGPMFREYCVAAAQAMNENWDMSFEYMVAAYKNMGGPFLRGKGFKADEGGAA